jgi:light-regulated signal transduction histidine kinase (bacteriophytochrome)
MIDYNINNNVNTNFNGQKLGYASDDKKVKELKSHLESQCTLKSESASQNLVQANLDLSAKTAYDELEALSYSISHDLRSPLYAIRNNVEWMNTRYAANLDNEGNTILRQITTSTERIEKLLDGLLEFSKVVGFVPQHTLVDMMKIAHMVIDELVERENWPSFPIVTLKPLLPSYCDETFIRQVWYNLISNAFKYTKNKQKREVMIDSYQIDGEIVYCVSDNGVGFDMQYVSNLFGAFHRLHSAEEFEGTGVGLAIVQRIIRRHGGRVWAEGEVDNGARFYFTLPNIQNNKLTIGLEL